MLGNINSIETMGLVDGPGIRFVIFLQGCPLRCVYCHNPETWDTKENLKMSVNELMQMILRYKEYFIDNGGVTVSGGEPLLQHEFVTELFKECHKNNIHTCLDTSGYQGSYPELIKYTDLVLLDIKGIDDIVTKKITSKVISNVFLNECQNQNKKIWIRHVIMPGINDSEEYILKFKEVIKNIKNIDKIELLPYHSMAKLKYNKLGFKYKLEELNDMDKSKVIELQKLLED
jgi:pyruvate formate lyase activating enzyme